MRVNDDKCDTCEEVFGYIHIFLDNNATEAELQNLLDNEVCPQLGDLSAMVGPRVLYIVHFEEQNLCM